MLIICYCYWKKCSQNASILIGKTIVLMFFFLETAAVKGPMIFKGKTLTGKTVILGLWRLLPFKCICYSRVNHWLFDSKNYCFKGFLLKLLPLRRLCYSRVNLLHFDRKKNYCFKVLFFWRLLPLNCLRYLRVNYWFLTGKISVLGFIT